MQILFYIIIFFIGYVFGRLGHVWLGSRIDFLHHWIYGLIIIILGVIFYKYILGQLMIFLGMGIFISDFNDFLHLKFYGRDKKEKKKFWGIN